MGAVYIVEQNVKVSSSCVYHRLYFTHKLKNPIIKPHRKISKEPAANYSLNCSDVIVPPLYTDRVLSYVCVSVYTCEVMSHSGYPIRHFNGTKPALECPVWRSLNAGR